MWWLSQCLTSHQIVNPTESGHSVSSPLWYPHPAPITMHRAGLGVFTSPMGRMSLPNTVFHRREPCLSSAPSLAHSLCLPSSSLLLLALSLSAPPWHPLSLTSSHFSVCISYYLLLPRLLPQLIKWYHRTGFICIWLRGFSAVGCMFIKWLCVEGCNEPILLQSSSLPILGGDYVFIRKKENCKPQLVEHEVWG